MKSSKTFCLFASIPDWCHSSPNSLPPRMLASAKTPPDRSQVVARAENAGIMALLKPP